MNRILGMCTCAVTATALIGGCAESPSSEVSLAEQAASAVSSGAVTATLETTSAWSGGFCQSVTIKNTGTTVTNWTLKIATNGATISSIWSANQTTSGTVMTVTPASYNATIASNGSVSFGYCGAGNAQPTLTSLSVTGGIGGTGGSSAVGGSTAKGGSTAAGGSTAKGGSTAAGGSTSRGGTTATGGTTAKGGSSSTGGSSTGGGAVKSSGCGKTASFSGQVTRTINVNGTNRSYIVRLPDNYDKNNPYRLITSIHCLNGTAAGVASGSNGTNYQFYGLWKLAGNSTIFVAPQGINNSWPNSGGSDVAFIKALVAELENTLCIDTTRIFSEGFSMGGSMSYALACAMPDKFRGVAVHSGGPMSGCDKTNRKPVAYFMTHGTKDSVCTYPGYGVPQINDFAALDGCRSMDIPNTLKPTDTTGRTPVCADYQGCAADDPARACIFIGDHTPSPGGEATTWVPGETWKFITRF
ncbi:MAG: cellulose binding domain-containing protein [Polyangiaceae bacterium]